MQRPPTIVLILPLHPLSLAASVISARQTDPCSQCAEAIHRHPLQLATIPCMDGACHGGPLPSPCFIHNLPSDPRGHLFDSAFLPFLPLPPTTLAARPCRFNRTSRTHIIQQARPSAYPSLLAKFGLARPSHLHPGNGRYFFRPPCVDRQAQPLVPQSLHEALLQSFTFC
jgi:hypothetical protein